MGKILHIEDAHLLRIADEDKCLFSLNIKEEEKLFSVIALRMSEDGSIGIGGKYKLLCYDIEDKLFCVDA